MQFSYERSIHRPDFVGRNTSGHDDGATERFAGVLVCENRAVDKSVKRHQCDSAEGALTA
jgi:hypothetical protein